MTLTVLPRATWSESSFRSTFSTQRAPRFHCSHSSGFDSLICFSKLPLWLNPPPLTLLLPTHPTKPSVTLPTFLYTSCPDHFKPKSTIKKTNARLYQTLWIHKAPHFIQTLLTFHFFVRYCYLPSTVKRIHRLAHLDLVFKNMSRTQN